MTMCLCKGVYKGCVFLIDDNIKENLKKSIIKLKYDTI